MFNIYRPKYEAQPLNVKEPSFGLSINLTYQIDEISLTPAGANRHTAHRRISREIFNLSLQF